MGRQLLADEPAFAAAVAELEPVFVEQVGFSLQQVLAGGEPVSGDRADSAGAGGDAVGADRVVALLRGAPGCGDRAFDGRGDRGGGGRRAEPSRGIAGDRHPLAADVAAGRTGRDGAAGTRCRGHRGVDRRLSRGHPGGVRLAAPDRDRRTARAGRCGDRRGAAAGSFRASGEHGGRLPYRVDGSDPARVAFGAGGFDTQEPDDSVHLHRRRHRWARTGA